MAKRKKIPVKQEKINQAIEEYTELMNEMLYDMRFKELVDLYYRYASQESTREI